MTGNGLNGMVLIAIIHIVWLLLFPLGLYFCLRGFAKRAHLIIGIILMALSVPALVFLRGFWPFDFFGAPKQRILTEAKNAGWKVVLIQKPDVDFYTTWFEITSPDGWTNSVCYDADDSKWWRATTLVQSNKVYFFRGNDQFDHSPSFLDVDQRVFWSGYYRHEERLTDPAQTK